MAADDQTGNLTETNSVSSCLYSLQYKMFQHVTNEPEAALSAPAVLLAELHLHTDATQPHLHICRCLLTACQQVGHKHKECQGFSFFICRGNNGNRETQVKYYSNRLLNLKMQLNNELLELQNCHVMLLLTTKKVI